MDPEKAKGIKNANSKLGRGCVYAGIIGVVAAYIPFIFIDWAVWIEILCALVAGPVVGLILYVPLSMTKSVGGFFVKSFDPTPDDETGEK